MISVLEFREVKANVVKLKTVTPRCAICVLTISLIVDYTMNWYGAYSEHSCDAITAKRFKNYRKNNIKKIVLVAFDKTGLDV